MKLRQESVKINGRGVSQYMHERRAVQRSGGMNVCMCILFTGVGVKVSDSVFSNDSFIGKT